MSTLHQQLERLAPYWPPGALVRNATGGLRGVITVVNDDTAARWNHGNPGHLGLMTLRHQSGMGGIVYAEWEHGDSSWSRVDALQVLDRSGLYWRWKYEPGHAPICRLAVVDDDELVWWASDELLPEWRWAARDDQLAIDALREGRKLKVGWL